MPRASNHLRRVTDSAPASRPAPRAARAPEGTFSATITSLEGDEVAIAPRTATAVGAHRARLAQIAGYRPHVGDVVMVAHDAEDLVVVAVLASKRPPSVVAPDGAHVALVDGALELVDREGRLLVRYVDGVAEVAPVSGDLRLAAPRGEVRIEAGTDVVVTARRDVAIVGDRTAELGAGARSVELPSSVKVEARGTAITGSHLDVTTRASRVTSGEATVVAREVRASATKIETAATKIETTAEHVVVRARTLLQDVTGVLESRLGRVRTLVKGSFALRSRSTSLKSQDDTSVDGRRVLLG